MENKVLTTSPQLLAEPLSPTVLAEAPTPVQEATVEASTPAATRLPIEVRFQDGNTRDFDLSSLRQAILAGEVSSTFETRTDRTKDGWLTVGQLSRQHFSLDILYQPVWAHTCRGFLYGAVIGVVLKSIDTCAALLAINPAVGMGFFAVGASLIVARWISYAPIIVGVLLAQQRMGVNPWMMFLGAAFAGFLFGAPLGAFIGTVVGYFRKKYLALAPDAAPEGKSTYYWGLLAPAVFLAIAVCLYLLWFMPNMEKWLS